jgi:hypothetical protein
MRTSGPVGDIPREDDRSGVWWVRVRRQREDELVLLLPELRAFPEGTGVVVLTVAVWPASRLGGGVGRGPADAEPERNTSSPSLRLLTLLEAPRDGT